MYSCLLCLFRAPIGMGRPHSIVPVLLMTSVHFYPVQTSPQNGCRDMVLRLDRQDNGMHSLHCAQSMHLSQTPTSLTS